ncbi:MAG: hypothetical protein V4732_04200 [Pseudomonadota bacterium]
MENKNISVNLVEAKNLNATSIHVTFKNNGSGAYFLDKKLAFANNKYYVDCLVLTMDGVSFERTKKFKVAESKFPEDYVKIEPGTSLSVELELNKHFSIPNSGVILVQYKGLNFNVELNKLDDILSNVIEIELGSKK